jgi:hypothetical protein
LHDINSDITPLFSAENGCKLEVAYADLPPLSEIENKLVALQIPYMHVVQLFEWKGAYQVAMKGNVINIPNNVCKVVHALLRLPEELMDATMCVSVYKHVESGFVFWNANVRPAIVHAYLDTLCNSTLYKENNINYDAGRNTAALKDVLTHVSGDNSCEEHELHDLVPLNEDPNISEEGAQLYDPCGSKVHNDFVLQEY